VGTIAFTGSAGGMGVATRALLESQGHRVIGVDLHDAEVIADVSTPDGRMEMVSGVIKECGDETVEHAAALLDDSGHHLHPAVRRGDVGDDLRVVQVDPDDAVAL